MQKIQISNPCHADSASFEKNEIGNYCHECKKNVIDLSEMTDRQILDYIAKNNVGCVSMRSDQVNRKLIPEHKRRLNFKLLYASLIGLLFVSKPVISQTIKPAYERLETQRLLAKPVEDIKIDTVGANASCNKPLTTGRIFGTGSVTQIVKTRKPGFFNWVSNIFRRNG